MPTKKQKTKNKNRGYTLIIAITFLAIVLIASSAMLNYVTSARKTAERYEATSGSLQVAEAGIQKALFCLNATNGSGCGGEYGTSYTGETGIIFDGNKIDIAVFEADGIMEVASTATSADGNVSTVIIRAIQDEDTYTEMTFAYAVMALGQALIKSDSAIQNGALYTDADLICDNRTGISGDVFVAKIGGLIDNCEITGDAHADNITRSKIGGDCYYKKIFENNTCGDVEYPNQKTPTVNKPPTLDLDFWHEQALTGGVISGDYEPEDGDSLGPVKIDGNFTIGNKDTLNMTGPIWVTGDFTMSNNSTLTLDPSFAELGSVILVDDPNGINGTADISKGSSINGSGVSGSYVVLISTSTDDQAISVKNNAGSGLYYAPNGSIHIANKASAVAVIGMNIKIDSQGEIIYDLGNLPAGLELQIETRDVPRWVVEPGTWREL